jgi:hypothetical protein
MRKPVADLSSMMTWKAEFKKEIKARALFSSIASQPKIIISFGLK